MDSANIIGREDGFWRSLDRLVSESAVTIDRPEGSTHPRYPDFRYPIDYGYLEGTKAADGSEIDVWRGSLPGQRVSAVLCTVDMVKRDAELKLLIGCTRDEAQTVLAASNSGLMAATLVEMPRDSID